MFGLKQSVKKQTRKQYYYNIILTVYEGHFK